MPVQPFDDLQRILVIRLDNIGDVVMTGPALRALRQAYPAAQITLMASPAGSQAAALLPWVDALITWRAIWQDISTPAPLEPDKEFELARLLREGRFDAAFILTSFSQSPHPPAYACYLAGIPIRVGQSKEFGGGLLSHWVKPLTDRSHQVERSLHLLRSCGIPADDPRLELQVQAEHQAGADSILAEAGIRAGDAFLALAPGASAQSRRYPEERFAQAAAMLVEQAGLPLVLLGSQREAGRFPLLEALAVRHPGVASFVGKTSVPEMAGVIQRCALLLGNNSGPMHLAGALNRPAVILFSGTEWIEQWAPVSGQMHLLNRATFCQPCHTFQCPYSLECLDIPAGEVVARAMQLLAHRTLPAPARFQDTIRR